MPMFASNNLWSLQNPSSSFTLPLPFSLGRRRFFSSICLRCSDTMAEDSYRSMDITIRDGIQCLEEVTSRGSIPSIKRRMLLASFPMLLAYNPPRYLPAKALGDPSVTVEQVTPPIIPTGPLFPTEERIVRLFEKNTYSVVNIFDVTLRPLLKVTGVVEIPEGNGSGVIWDRQGHVVTNYHVIGNSLSRNPKPGEVVARINILTSEGVQKNFEGRLVGADRTKDLAVLKVEAPEEVLNPTKLGQSGFVKVGQQCLAIGNPFGFDHTLTVGVISGLNRDIFSQTGVTISGGIQTDAAINPGNSGGPLLDSKGNLIGINTAIFTQTGTSAGVGFAIPSSTVVKIVPQLIQFGKVSNGSGFSFAFQLQYNSRHLNMSDLTWFLLIRLFELD
ncbi:Protease Do-like 8, chloroplastic [Linum grandiflorum]